MADTSYRPDYAPYARSGFTQTSVPQTTHNLPATIAANSSASSSLIVTEGFSLIAVGLTSTQAGSLSAQRYLDAGGTVAQGAPVSVTLAANVAANLDVLDGKPFASFMITVTNSAGSQATLSNIAILLQTGSGSRDTAVDGSTSITTGGTAQTLFGGAVPANGFGIYNPDPTNDLWISDTATAAPNGQGSLRIAANGGGYETPQGYKSPGAVSIYGAVTGQKISARRW